MKSEETVAAIIKARDEVYQSRLEICTCSGFVIQREGCQCGRRARVLEAEARLKALIDNL